MFYLRYFSDASPISYKRDQSFIKMVWRVSWLVTSTPLKLTDPILTLHVLLWKNRQIKVKFEFVVSTHLKNICQIGSSPQGVEITKCFKPQPRIEFEQWYKAIILRLEVNHPRCFWRTDYLKTNGPAPGKNISFSSWLEKQIKLDL